jgi:hypothetical protein
LIKRLLKTAGSQDDIQVGTIHQFQGSEADVIIFDMVDGPSRPGLGKLLRGDTGLRLVNVAVSRARGKLIVLADKSWCKKVLCRSDNSVLWNLVMIERPGGMRVDQPRRIHPDVAANQVDIRLKPAAGPLDVPENVGAVWLEQ